LYAGIQPLTIKNKTMTQKLLASMRIFILATVLVLGAGLKAQTITTFPWTETFNTDSPTLQYWTQIYEVNNMSWTFTNDATTGSYNLDPYDGNFANFPADSHNFDTTKLVSPVLDISGLANVTLNFVYVNPLWSPDQNWLTIYYRTSSAGPWVQLQEYHTNITTWTPSGNISLPNPSATYQIAIECRTDYGWSTLVDQVVVAGTAAVDVTSVDVTTQGGVPAEITTASGTLQLNASVLPANASQAVTWTVVTGAANASVNASGVVTGLANGTAVIRATSVSDPTKFDEITVIINMPVVTGVEISTVNSVPAIITSAGGTLPLTAAVLPSTANQNVTWSVVAGAAYGSVSATGVVTGTANGILTVQATSVADPTKFDILDVVVNIAVTGVEVTTQGNVPATITTGGGTLQLVATVAPAAASQNVTWSVVSGSEFGSVSATGLVTGTGTGTITIRATSVADPTKFDDIVITITIAVEPESVEVNTLGGVAATITTIGGTLQLVATVNPAGVNQDVTWSIVNGGAFATLSADGLVTATANGIVTVRATSIEDITLFDAIDIVINDTTAGVDTFGLKAAKLYPNPTTGIVTIETQDTIRTVEVYNMLGQLALSKAAVNNIDMSAFPAGNYIVKVATDTASKSFKVVRE
jgi:hypothetical protein